MTVEQGKTHVQMVEKYATSREGPLPSNKVIAEGIAEAFGINLNSVQIETAIQHSRQHKVKPTPEALIYDGTNTRRIQGIMLGKGNVWPDIEPYARLGMRGKEIHLALLLEKRRDINEASINQALGHRKRIGQLDIVTPEERYNVAQTIRHGTDEEIEGRVRLWLKLRDFYRDLGVNTRHFKRMDWLRMDAMEWFGLMKVPLIPQVQNLENDSLPTSESTFKSNGVINPLQMSLPEDPLTSKGSKVNLKGGQVGIVEGTVTMENNAQYVKIRLLTGVESAQLHETQPGPESMGFGGNTYRFIPVATIHKRAELIPQEETN